jgi:quercetin dioxygenase-like cupin family protein
MLSSASNAEVRVTKSAILTAAKDGNEEEVCEKLGEMLELAASGSSENRLMMQEGENGMRVVHVWFGPNFQLFRHSHPAGDCTYLIMAGELTMGKRTLKAGSTVFVPNQMPYKFVAGPDGVEVVEFRSGGRIPGKPGIRIEENSLEAVQNLIDDYKANQHLWIAPPTFSDF